MALAGILPYHTETWHVMRLQMLKKKGADLRMTRDIWGRAPLLIAMEEYNVGFIRALFRVEVYFFAISIQNSCNLWSLP